LACSHWHEGVVGIIASRITETYHRPAVVISLGEEIGKGSIRSFAGKNILEGLQMTKKYLTKFGGHPYAAGLSIHFSQVEAFTLAFNQAMEKLPQDLHLSSLMLEGNCALEDLTLQSLQELEKLGPFGPGNPEPIFSFQAMVKSHQVLKGRHLKLGLTSHNNSQVMTEAIWFYGMDCKELCLETLIHQHCQWAAVPELNRFRGRLNPVLRIKDWRKISIASE